MDPHHHPSPFNNYCGHIFFSNTFIQQFCTVGVTLYSSVLYVHMYYTKGREQPIHNIMILFNQFDLSVVR